MIETRGPANCAFCLKNYCSACPVQRTKGSYEEAASSARHWEVLGLPLSGHPIWPCPRPLCQSSPIAGREITALPQACWLGDNPQEMQ